METFLLVFAAIFPVVNPPGAALIFLGMTQGASSQTRRWLARRVAVNAFVIMNLSLTVGALVMKIYGISIPVLRVAGGLIVAVAGWKLLNEENSKAADETAASKERNADFTDLAFYPLTMPLTTGPGTIAVMISVGLSRSVYSDGRIIPFLVAVLLATMVIALMIYICFAYSDRVPRLLGAVGTDILVRLTAFILFCLGVQIIWTGASELLGTVTLQRATMAMPLVTTEDFFRQL